MKLFNLVFCILVIAFILWLLTKKSHEGYDLNGSKLMCPDVPYTCISEDSCNVWQTVAYPRGPGNNDPLPKTYDCCLSCATPNTCHYGYDPDKRVCCEFGYDSTAKKCYDMLPNPGTGRD